MTKMLPILTLHAYIDMAMHRPWGGERLALGKPQNSGEDHKEMRCTLRLSTEVFPRRSEA